MRLNHRLNNLPTVYDPFQILLVLAFNRYRSHFLSDCRAIGVAFGHQDAKKLALGVPRGISVHDCFSSRRVSCVRRNGWIPKQGELDKRSDYNGRLLPFYRRRR